MSPARDGVVSFLVLAGAVLVHPFSLQVSLVVGAALLLRRWCRWRRRVRDKGLALARLRRCRWRRHQASVAELERLTVAALQRRRLPDTPENRLRVRWSL